MEKIGILHPGEMGISVAASAQRGGNTVFWASEGRSPQTRQRAEKHALLDAGSLENLCGTCSIILSVCPPDAAEAVARQVLAHSFNGLYVDANAISPQRAMRIGAAMAEHDVEFVDGGIIGGPAWEAGSTWLYLSGKGAARAANCFAAGPLRSTGVLPVQARVIGDTIGKASALKMSYAAYSKGTTALLCAVLAAAEVLGVRSELEEQWSRDDPGFPVQAGERARRVTAKAWRFAGEMDEIAATFEGAGLPDGFHKSAAALYRRLAGFKGADERPSLELVLQALLRDPAREEDARR